MFFSGSSKTSWAALAALNIMCGYCSVDPVPGDIRVCDKWSCIKDGIWVEIEEVSPTHITVRNDPIMAPIYGLKTDPFKVTREKFLEEYKMENREDDVMEDIKVGDLFVKSRGKSNDLDIKESDKIVITAVGDTIEADIVSSRVAPLRLKQKNFTCKADDFVKDFDIPVRFEEVKKDSPHHSTNAKHLTFKKDDSEEEEYVAIYGDKDLNHEMRVYEALGQKFSTKEFVKRIKINHKFIKETRPFAGREYKVTCVGSGDQKDELRFEMYMGDTSTKLSFSRARLFADYIKTLGK